MSKFDELSVKALWSDLKNDPAFNIYFQDNYADDKSPARHYFFCILNSIYPEYLKQIMDNAANQRYGVDGEK